MVAHNSKKESSFPSREHSTKSVRETAPSWHPRDEGDSEREERKQQRWTKKSIIKSPCEQARPQLLLLLPSGVTQPWYTSISGVQSAESLVWASHQSEHTYESEDITGMISCLPCPHDSLTRVTNMILCYLHRSPGPEDRQNTGKECYLVSKHHRAQPPLNVVEDVPLTVLPQVGGSKCCALGNYWLTQWKPLAVRSLTVASAFQVWWVHCPVSFNW